MSTRTTTLSVQGMHCSSCVKRVERALAAVKGVKSVKVDLATELAVIESEAGQVDVLELSEAVRNIGFNASVAAPR